MVRGICVWQKLGLRAKLFGAGLTAVLLSSLFLGGYALHKGEEAIVAEVEARLTQDAQRAAQRIGDMLSDAASDLEIWARMDIAPQALDNKAPKFFAEFARQAVTNKGVYAHMVPALLEGDLFAMNEVGDAGQTIASHPLPPASFAGESWFRSAEENSAVEVHGPLRPAAIAKATSGGSVGIEILVTHPVLDIMDDPVGQVVGALEIASGHMDKIVGMSATIEDLAEQSARATREIRTLVTEVKTHSDQISSTEQTSARIMEFASSIEQQSQAAAEIPRLLASADDLSSATKQDLDAASDSVPVPVDASAKLQSILERFRQN